MSRETSCRRIVENLRDLERELIGLRKQAERVEERLREQRDELSKEIDNSAGHGGLDRRPSRGGRVGFVLDIIAALGQVLANDNSDAIRLLERDIAQSTSQLDATVFAIRNG